MGQIAVPKTLDRKATDKVTPISMPKGPLPSADTLSVQGTGLADEKDGTQLSINAHGDVPMQAAGVTATVAGSKSAAVPSFPVFPSVDTSSFLVPGILDEMRHQYQARGASSSDPEEEANIARQAVSGYHGLVNLDGHAFPPKSTRPLFQEASAIRSHERTNSIITEGAKAGEQDTLISSATCHRPLTVEKVLKNGHQERPMHPSSLESAATIPPSQANSSFLSPHDFIINERHRSHGAFQSLGLFPSTGSSDKGHQSHMLVVDDASTSNHSKVGSLAQEQPKRRIGFHNFSGSRSVPDMKPLSDEWEPHNARGTRRKEKAAPINREESPVSPHEGSTMTALRRALWRAEVLKQNDKEILDLTANESTKHKFRNLFFFLCLFPLFLVGFWFVVLSIDVAIDPLFPLTPTISSTSSSPLKISEAPRNALRRAGLVSSLDVTDISLGNYSLDGLFASDQFPNNSLFSISGNVVAKSHEADHSKPSVARRAANRPSVLLDPLVRQNTAPLKFRDVFIEMIDVSSQQIQVFSGTTARCLAAIFSGLISVTGFVLQMSVTRFGPQVRTLYFRSRIATITICFVCASLIYSIFLEYAVSSVYLLPRVANLLVLIMTFLSIIFVYPYFVFLFNFLDPARIVHYTKKRGIAAIEAERVFTERSYSTAPTKPGRMDYDDFSLDALGPVKPATNGLGVFSSSTDLKESAIGVRFQNQTLQERTLSVDLFQSESDHVQDSAPKLGSMARARAHLSKSLHSVKNSFAQQQRGATAAKHHRLNRHQQRCNKSMEVLTEIARVALSRKEKNVAHTVLKALFLFANRYSTQKGTLSEEWFVIPSWMRQTTDFVGLSDDAVIRLRKQRAWFEYKLLRKHLYIYTDALAHFKDIAAICVTNTRVIAVNAVLRHDFAVVDLCIKYFNTYLRMAMDARDASCTASVVQQYRITIEFFFATSYRLFKTTLTANHSMKVPSEQHAETNFGEKDHVPYMPPHARDLKEGPASLVDFSLPEMSEMAFLREPEDGKGGLSISSQRSSDHAFLFAPGRADATQSHLTTLEPKLQCDMENESHHVDSGVSTLSTFIPVPGLIPPKQQKPRQQAARTIPYPSQIPEISEHDSYLKYSASMHPLIRDISSANEHRTTEDVERLIKELSKRALLVGRFLMQYFVTSIENHLASVGESIMHELTTLCESAFTLYSPCHSELLELILHPDHYSASTASWSDSSTGIFAKVPLGVLMAQVKLATTYIVLGAPQYAQQVHYAMRKIPQETMRLVCWRLDNTQDAEIWEISDFSRSANYLPVAQRAALAAFNSWPQAADMADDMDLRFPLSGSGIDQETEETMPRLSRRFSHIHDV